MRIIICSNIENSNGLKKDYELLRAHLESLGHEVAGQQFDQPASVAPGDLLIWLEVINEHLINLAPRNWLIANNEWLKPEYIRPIQRHCEKVFAKTRDAERELRQKFSNVHYVGFLAADKRVDAYQREKKRAFVHLGGNSGMRNTNAVISAWREYRYWDGEDIGTELTVVSNSKETAEFEDTPGITFIKRATDEQVTELQNECLFHLAPSAYEGFGQALHESQSVGAVILTTDHPPMNELNAPFNVPVERVKRNNLANLAEVSGREIRERVRSMLNLPAHVVARISLEARSRFEKGNEEFKKLFSSHLTESKTEYYGYAQGNKPEYIKVGVPLIRLAILGNFHPPHSTENELLWTLRDMGYYVTPFQENEDSVELILETCEKERIELFIWVHTHGYQMISLEK